MLKPDLNTDLGVLRTVQDAIDRPAANTAFEPLTKVQAMTQPRTMYHKKMRNSDGTALRARANGKCKTWVTRPDEFQLPAKHGLYTTFYITHANAGEWSLQDPTAKPAQA